VSARATARVPRRDGKRIHFLLLIIFMFDFEKLTVYTKAKIYNKEISIMLKQITIDTTTKNQLKRSSLSIVLNIAEGTGRNTNADKRILHNIERFLCICFCALAGVPPISFIKQIFGKF
jgi:hypothetical protein